MRKHLTTHLLVIGTAVAAIAFAATAATGSPTSANTQVYKTMIIVGHALGQKAPDGLQHDTTYGANFSVKKGQRVTVTVYNFDEGPHTITASRLKLNIKISTGSSVTSARARGSMRICARTESHAGSARRTSSRYSESCRRLSTTWSATPQRRPSRFASASPRTSALP